MDLLNYFTRVVLVNLDRRPDRLVESHRRFTPPQWPFKEPERERAVDGKCVGLPQWMKHSGAGAWGILQTTTRILEDAIMDKVPSLLVLEDDAVPCDGFVEKVEAFLEALPADKELVYLGGQTNHHNKPSRPVNSEVVRPWSVNRLHAYALFGTEAMKKVYHHITANDWKGGHHVDHRIEILTRKNRIVTYAPREWLVAQSDGHSDICERNLGVRFFDNRLGRKTTKYPAVIAVLGPYRGGTSATAGVLHHLGVVMGHYFIDGNQQATPKGCFEARMLFEICNACYPEPHFVEGRPQNRRVKLLRQWLDGRKNEGPVIGAKHPKLCLMVPELLESWPHCKFVAVDRPLDESIASLKRFGWFTQGIAPDVLIRKLVSARDESLAKVDQSRVHRLAFADLLKQPDEEIARLVAFCGIKPLGEQTERAKAFLDPTLKHYGESTA